MRLLVTGGLGFIGSNFIAYHLMRHPEDSLLNLDKETYAASPLAKKELRKYPNYILVKGDVCDKAVVRKCMRQADIVVHFAAETHVDRSINDWRPFERTNVLGTLTLLEEARKSGVKRFHHVSTDEVYGSLSLDSKEKFDENSNYNPRNPYSASKASSDFFVRAYHETHGLQTTISNCSNNFGPFQNPEKLVPKAILNALARHPIPLYGDGRHVRDWLYVEDHCSALDLILERGRPGKTYCISAGNEFSNIDIVTRILELMGVKENLIEFVAERPGHDRRYALDSRRIRQELGWRPEHDFNQCLERTIGWYSNRRGDLKAGER